MDQLQAHWFLERKNLLFHSLQIWMTKILLVNSDVSYSIQIWHQITASSILKINKIGMEIVLVICKYKIIL